MEKNGIRLRWFHGSLYSCGSRVAVLAPIALDGEWRFAIDREDVGLKQQWYARDLSDWIKLPGILQSQGYGDEISVDTPWVAALPRDMRWYRLPQYQAYTKPGNIKMPYLSQPQRHFLGLAWYQREIDIPQDWQGKNIRLMLERPRWETTVWHGRISRPKAIYSDYPSGAWPWRLLLPRHKYGFGIPPEIAWYPSWVW
jgi:hypothetical protein